MTLLSELFDLSELQIELAGGYVRRQYHPVEPLAILNYAEKAVFERRWNEVTLPCRGLIYNTHTLEVIARPMEKFFNWDESHVPYPPSGPMLASAKFDGSLGIMYWVDGDIEPLLATRGSFTSDQALKGTQILRDWMTPQIGAANFFQPRRDMTYLFEIIYPENRIVCNYGDSEMLVLLTVIDNMTGRADIQEFDECEWPIKAEKTLLPKFDPTLLYDMTGEGDEGLVLYWPHQDFRTKLKRADYVALHRIVTGLNERTVWSAFGPDGKGTSLQKFCEPLPDEFHLWVAEVVLRLRTEHTRILAATYDAYDEVRANAAIFFGDNYTRRDFAYCVKVARESPHMFMLLDGNEQKLKEKVWASLRPEGAKYAKQMSEDVA